MVDGVEGKDFVVAPYAVEDTELGRMVYGSGDRVPMDDAVKYGLVAKSSPRKSKREPAENRARKSSRTRKKA